MALGIPDRSVKSSPREAQYETWELTIHEHHAKRAGLHYDIRLSDPKTGKALSWAVRNLPDSPGKKTLAVHQPDHTIEYTSFEGTIEKGYGAGEVKIYDKQPIEILSSEPNKITFNVYKGQQTEKYSLIRTGGDNWLYYNHTPTKEKMADLPQYKHSYKNVKPEQIDFRNSQEVLTPKYDGAAVLFNMKPGKPINIFSYRPSKKSETGLIEHTYRTDLYKVRVPKSVGNTIVRAELFGRDNTGKAIPSQRTGGILNSNVWKSREKQSDEGKLDHVIYDVVKYKGRFVENEPYEKKLQYIQEIVQEIPELRVPPTAKTVQEKQRLYDAVVSNQLPDTTEGFVIYDKSQSVPKKAKIVADSDVYIKEIFPGKGRLKEKGAGGFSYSLTPGGPAVGKVGTGFSDEVRMQMIKEPQKFINAVAKIRSQEQLPSGAYRAPSYQEIRYEKFPISKTAKAKDEKTAVIIKGNPKYIEGNEKADIFYKELKKLLEEKNYSVTFDAGKPYTTPPKADLWVGHSRGVDRLRFAPKGTKTISTGSPTTGSINHPKDHPHKDKIPNKYHYVINKDMRDQILKTASESHPRYFVGVQAGPTHEHMTLKYIGAKSPAQIEEVKKKMEGLKEVEKFVMKSEGLGLLGKGRSHLVNYIKPLDRIEEAQNILGVNIEDQVPHVTVMQAPNTTVKTGPIPLMDTQLVEEVHLYKIHGYRNYEPVHTVKLKSRRPLTWLKDMVKDASETNKLNIDKT